MPRTVSRPRIDLFDDPSWDSPESRAETADYERLTMPLFSARTESAMTVLAVALYGMHIVSICLLLWSFTSLLDHLFVGIPFSFSFP
jgi:hypothetical protein